MDLKKRLCGAVHRDGKFDGFLTGYSEEEINEKAKIMKVTRFGKLFKIHGNRQLPLKRFDKYEEECFTPEGLP